MAAEEGVAWVYAGATARMRARTARHPEPRAASQEFLVSPLDELLLLLSLSLLLLLPPYASNRDPNGSVVLK